MMLWPDLIVGIFLGAGIAGLAVYMAHGGLRQAIKDLKAQGQALLEEREAFQAKAMQLEENLRLESMQRAVLESRVLQLEKVEADARHLSATLSAMQAEKAMLAERLEQERKSAQEKIGLLHEAEKRLLDTFKALSHDVLRENNHSFLTLAQEKLGALQQSAQSELDLKQKAINDLVKPLQDSLLKVDSRIGEIEKARIDAYSALNTQLHALLDTHLPSLHEETAKLVKALRQPSARGRWGEMQLKRVVEMAGMLEHCDFSEQVSYTDAEEKRQRPDMIVHLPGGKQIVVDAKAPLSAYLEAIEATEETARQVSLAQHTQQLKKHIQSLGQKSYWAQFQPTPEFVILFLPGETFLSAAFTEDPNLLEFAIAHKVIPATPTTLIALLKAVAYGWQQEVLTENAKAISTLGKELYERLVTLGTHWASVGKGLEAATKAYNEATGSLESRVLVSARRLRELRHLDKELPPIQSVDRIPRQLQEPDMLLPSEVQEAAGQDGAGNAG